MKYSQGVLIGRFQPLHKGHIAVIEFALEHCEKLLVFIGSAQEEKTERNPYSYLQRERMLRAVFGERIQIAPLIDIHVGDNPIWWAFVMDQAKKQGITPDVFFGGGEEKHKKWLEECGVASLSYSREILPISSTMVRKALKEGDPAYKDWVDPRVLPLL